jgi:glycosyltransferase involved in cell wall biosynthesis
LKNPFIIRLLEHLELGLYNRAVQIITVTEAFRQNLILRGVPAAKVSTVTNGADVEFWRPCDSPVALRHRLGLEDSFVVLYIGAHGISHSLGRILESAERLQDYPSIQFLFVGDGAEKDKLLQHAQEARLENIRFLDPVDKENVREFYNMADICLVPLRDVPLFETFIPSKMFEIMAMGRPIIGSLRGEAADILQRSKGALVVAPEDSEAIGRAILELYNNPERARTMGENGRRFVISHYSRESQAAHYIEILNKAVQEFWGNQ